MKGLVSVIIPMYNSSKYIERCVLSVLDQTYKHIEVILIDNNSDDDTWNICESIKGVKLLKEPNQGVGVARNSGIGCVTGEYIAFVDSDDYIESDYIEKLVSAYDVSDCGLSVCGYYSENEAGKVLRKTKGKERVYLRDDAIDCLLRPDVFEGYLWNKLFLSQIIQKNGIRFREDIIIWEDLIFVMEYLTHVKKVIYNPVALYHYIARKGSTVNKRFIKRENYDYRYLTELEAADIIMSMLPKSCIKAKRTLKYRKTESSIGIIESVLRCENIDCGIIIAMQKNIREGYPDFLMFSNHADGIKKLLGITLCFTVRIADIYWKYKHDLKKV